MYGVSWVYGLTPWIVLSITGLIGYKIYECFGLDEYPSLISNALLLLELYWVEYTVDQICQKIFSLTGYRDVGGFYGESLKIKIGFFIGAAVLWFLSQKWLHNKLHSVVIGNETPYC